MDPQRLHAGYMQAPDIPTAVLPAKPSSPMLGVPELPAFPPDSPTRKNSSPHQLSDSPVHSTFISGERQRAGDMVRRARVREGSAPLQPAPAPATAPASGADAVAPDRARCSPAPARRPLCAGARAQDARRGRQAGQVLHRQALVSGPRRPSGRRLSLHVTVGLRGEAYMR